MATAADTPKLDASKIVDIDVFSEETRQNWFEFATEWAKSTPFYVINHDIPQAVVARNKDVKEVLLDAKRFTSTPPAAASAHFDAFMGLTHLGVLNGPAHDRIRRILQPWFGAGGVRKLEGEIERHVNELVDALEAKQARGEQVDLIWDYSRQLIPRIMLGTMFGLSEERQASSSSA